MLKPPCLGFDTGASTNKNTCGVCFAYSNTKNKRITASNRSCPIYMAPYLLGCDLRSVNWCVLLTLSLVEKWMYCPKICSARCLGSLWSTLYLRLRTCTRGKSSAAIAIQRTLFLFKVSWRVPILFKGSYLKGFFEGSLSSFFQGFLS